MNPSDDPLIQEVSPSPGPRTPEQIPFPRENLVQKAKRQISLTLLSLLFILLVADVVTTVVAFVIKLRFPTLLTLPGSLIILSSLPTYAIAMPLSLLLFGKIPKAPPEKRKLAFPSFIGFFCIALLVTFLGGIVGAMISEGFGSITGETPTNTLEEVANASPLLIQFIVFVILAPIFEEIFYRKLLFDRLCTFGELPAILICGITFGLIHGNFYQFFYATAAGFLFSFVYAKTGRLIYTIGLHALLNFSGTILTEWIDNLLASHSAFLSFAGMAFAILSLLFLLLGTAFAILFWITRHKKVSFDRGKTPLDGRQWTSAVFANPTTWIFLVLVLLPFFSDLFLSLLSNF